MNSKHAWLLLRGVLLAAAGAAVAYCGHLATDGDALGTYGPLVGSVCTILTDVIHTLSQRARAEPDAEEECPETPDYEG